MHEFTETRLADIMTQDTNIDQKYAAQIAMQTLSFLKYYHALGLSYEGLAPTHIYLLNRDPRNIVVKIPNVHLTRLMNETIRIYDKEVASIVGHCFSP